MKTKPVRKIARADVMAASKTSGAAERIRDATLGKLARDRGMGWYEGTRRIGRAKYSIAVRCGDLDDARDVAKSIARAGPIVTALERDWPALLDAIADELHDLYETTWRGARASVSRESFKKQLVPSEVVVGPTRTTVYLRSGQFFLDHGVEVRIPARGKRREILIS